MINRSQKDIQENLPIRKGLGKELKFFQTHPKYRTVLSKCGTGNMARTLNQLLMHHIRDCLPEIRARINKLLISVQSNIASLGESMDDKGSSEKGVALLQILSQFAYNFGNKVEGKGSNEVSSEMTELYGGARVSYIFNEVFGKRLKSLDPFEGLTDEDIRTAIANANGTRPSLFVPEISFDLLVRRQIVRLEQPGLDCLDLVHDEVQKMVSQSETMELERFPDLRDRTVEVTNILLRRCMQPAREMISNLIKIELAYINTSHPDFVGGKQAVAVAQQSRKLQHQAQQQARSANFTGDATAVGEGLPPHIQQQQQQLQMQQQQRGGPLPLPPPQAAGDSGNRGFMGVFQMSPKVAASPTPAGAAPQSHASAASSMRRSPQKDPGEFSVIKLSEVRETRKERPFLIIVYIMMEAFICWCSDSSWFD